MLLLDKVTESNVTQLLTFTESLHLNFLDVQSLPQMASGSTPAPTAWANLTAVCIVQPTIESVTTIGTLVKLGQFRDYQLIFTNFLPKALLERLARLDAQSARKPFICQCTL